MADPGLGLPLNKNPFPSMLALHGRTTPSPSSLSCSDFCLHAITIDELQLKFPGIHSTCEEVVSEDTVLPSPIYLNTRGFIESLAKQINASFENNIYDGCAVLMRRLLEICIILSFENLKIDSEIRDGSGNYVPLEAIMSHAKSSSTLKLSRDTRAIMDDFRTLGNFSAHKIYYNCRRDDLKTFLKSYRAAIEELLYKAGDKEIAPTCRSTGFASLPGELFVTQSTPKAQHIDKAHRW